MQMQMQMEQVVDADGDSDAAQRQLRQKGKVRTSVAQQIDNNDEGGLLTACETDTGQTHDHLKQAIILLPQSFHGPKATEIIWHTCAYQR